MSKERLGAFMDAVIAIVMTILVLELEKPAAPTLAALWALRINFAAYALSFLWLAALWTSLHNAWHVIEKISSRTVWLSIGLLFFSSLFPYATSLVSTYFTSRVVQGFYGVIVIATTVMLLLIYKSLEKDNPPERTVKHMQAVSRFLRTDLLIKVAGMIAGVLFWPPIVSLGVLAAAIFIMTARKGSAGYGVIDTKGRRNAN